MHKSELARSVWDKLRQNGVRKNINVPSHVLHITDDEGNQCHFRVKKVDKTAGYTIPDVEAIIDNILEVVLDTVKKGEPINISGFGTLDLRHRPSRVICDVSTKQNVEIPDYYTVKFTPGKNMKIAAKLYTISKKENGAEDFVPSLQFVIK